MVELLTPSAIIVTGTADKIDSIVFSVLFRCIDAEVIQICYDFTYEKRNDDFKCTIYTTGDKTVGIINSEYIFLIPDVTLNIQMAIGDSCIPYCMSDDFVIRQEWNVPVEDYYELRTYWK